MTSTDWNSGKSYFNDLDYYQFQNMSIHEHADVQKEKSLSHVYTYLHIHCKYISLYINLYIQNIKRSGYILIF